MQWGRMVSCAAIGNRRVCRLPIGTQLAKLPREPRNPFGRPLFQNLQYSDTPTQPLVSMRFTDTTARPGVVHAYKVIAVNSAGIKSEPSENVHNK